MIDQITRLSITEYGDPIDLYDKIPKTSQIDRLSANKIFTEAGLRVANYLGIKNNPITFEKNWIRAKDFAGIIKLTPTLELEISPKFLGLNDGTGWREDFFFLSTLSRHGQLLISEDLSSSSGLARDLSTLVARAFTSMYQRQRHRPLRAYSKTKKSDFSLDGEPDPTDLMFPNSDGYEQEITTFDRNNVWNKNIYLAAKELLAEVNDITAANLSHVIQNLSPQTKSRLLFIKDTPSRHRAWQPLYDLSIDVLQGLGLTFRQGQAHAPGFVASTWKIWEDLIAVGCRMSFGRSLVATQSGSKLGERSKETKNGKKVTQLTVYPDFVIEADQSNSRFIVDAKYKGNIEYGSIRVSESDVYESLAFARATGCNDVLLVYPALSNNILSSVGACNVFEKIQIGSINIYGIQIEVRGISKKGALKSFSFNLKEGLLNALNNVD